MAACKVDERFVDAPDDGVRRFESLRNAHRIEVPGPLRVDIVARQTLPRADIGLNKASVEHRSRRTECGTDELGSSGRALQRARDDRVDGIETRGREQSLSTSTLREGYVGATLPATGNVPLGFAVTEHEHAGDRR